MIWGNTVSKDQSMPYKYLLVTKHVCAGQQSNKAVGIILIL